MEKQTKRQIDKQTNRKTEKQGNRQIDKVHLSRQTNMYKNTNECSTRLRAKLSLQFFALADVLKLNGSKTYQFRITKEYNFRFEVRSLEGVAISLKLDVWDLWYVFK